MQVPVYAINLERSRDRWLQLESNARDIGVELRRVNAVEGKALREDELDRLDEASFRRRHGKMVMPAEIGCYFSHLNALEIIAEAPEPFAVIVEDDVVFTPDFLPFTTSLTQLNGWDVVKLVNHRVPAFRRFYKVNDKHVIGRCLHGPIGSSAAYVVTRDGAKKLLAALEPMSLPYDVALERGWAGDYEIFTTEKPVVSLSAVAPSTIADGRSAYARTRLPLWKRVTTLFFRIKDYLSRIFYGLKRRTNRGQIK